MLRILIFLLLPLGLCAQSSPVLEGYIQEGLRSNLSLRERDYNVEMSRLAIRQARALFQPNVQFNANYTLAAGGRDIDFPIGDLLNPAYATLNQLTQSNQFPMLENQQINFLPNNFQETKIKFAYPLYNSDLKYNKQIQEHQLTGQVAQKAALEQELRFEITEAYLQYVQALEAEKIWTGVRTTLTELRRFNESLVKNDVATRDIVATADYQLSENELQIGTTRLQQQSARAYFNFLINKDLNSDVTVDPAVLTVELPAFQRDSCIALALRNRQELTALQAGQAAANTAVDLQAANIKLPDFYVGGELGFQGFGYRVWDDQAYVLAQVGMTYDLYNGGQNKIKHQQARIDAQKVSLQTEQVRRQIALQVWDAYNQYETARLAIKTRQDAVNSANESFRIVGNKYRNGQALLIEYSDAQNRVSTARMQLLLAQIEVRKKAAALEQTMGGK